MVAFESHETDETGYTHTIRVNGKNILTQWGIEFVDGDSFFQHGRHSTAVFALKKLERGPAFTTATFSVALQSALMEVKLHETFSSTTITREYHLQPNSDCFLMDIAISQAFSKSLFQQAQIGQHTFAFDNLERNHQFETTFASLQGNDFSLYFSLETAYQNISFIPVIYVRMSPRLGWVIHSRLFPQKADKKMILLCRKGWNKKIPFSNFFSAISPLTRYLWYVGEKPETIRRRTAGLAAFGLVKIPAKTSIYLKQTIQFKPFFSEATSPPPTSTRVQTQD